MDVNKARQLFNFFVRCYPTGSVLPSSTVWHRYRIRPSELWTGTGIAVAVGLFGRCDSVLWFCTLDLLGCYCYR